MHDQTFAEAAREWKESFAKWEAGERPSYCGDKNRHLEFWEYEGDPPERKYYRPWEKSEATWFQVWETVSEGTPVSPPFETKEELISYLADNGDYWDQKGWGRENAERFVNDEYAFSFVVTGGVLYKGAAQAQEIANALGEK